MTHWALFFGRFHPLLVHLPIGFLALLVVVEVADRLRWFRGAAAARAPIVIVTVAASVLTVILGLMLASAGGYEGPLIAWHKWTGLLTAAAVITTAVMLWRRRLRWYRASLAFTVLLLTVASHFGGSVTHGPDYLTAYAPHWLGGGVTTVSIAPPPRPGKISDPMQARLFGDIVQPILTDNCLGCHNATHPAGGLALVSFASLNKGGGSGPGIVPGKASASLIVQRMHLPAIEARHMPPDGKPQPSDDQQALIEWWIDSGASENSTVADLHPSDGQLALVNTLLKLPAAVTTTEIAPVALDQLSINSIAEQTHAVIVPVSAGVNLLNINAAVARGFGDAQLQQLIPLGPDVDSLNLSGTHVTDSGLAALKQMTNIRQLRLDRTAITDAGLKSLSGLKKLEYLNLYSTAVTSAGLHELQPLPELRHLYLWQTKVDPKTARKFADDHVDPLKTARLQKQIADLQSQLARQQITVDTGTTALPAVNKVTADTKPPTSQKTVAAGKK